MPRRVQDIIPGNRRTIRDIPVEKALPEKPEKEDVIKIHNVERPISIRRMPITPPPETPKRRGKSGRYLPKHLPWIGGVIGAVVVLAGIAFFLSGRLAEATFNIAPRSLPVQVAGTYVIPATASDAMPLSYTVVIETGSTSATVPATLGASVQTKATGSVTLFNSYSSQSQRLVAGTRLADDSGLIYRLTSSVIVPGYTSKTGSTIPGSITAKIIADQPGVEYNISGSDSISDFKIVAYKGTPRYDSLYARVSSDVSGGFSGVKSTVAAGTLASTTALLQANLLSSLWSKANSSVPAGYIMYDGAYAKSFGVPSVTSINSTSANVTITGKIWGVTFKASDLAAMLAGASSTTSFGSLPYETPGLEKLSFSIANPNTFSPANKSPLVAKISGSFKLVGSIPVDTLKKAFAGVSLAETGTILKKYAAIINIKDSSGEIAPPWVGTVPSNISRITINVGKP
jgi:hypothetical protein